MKLINLNFTKKNLTFFLLLIIIFSISISISTKLKKTTLKINSRNNKNNNVNNKNLFRNKIKSTDVPFQNPFGNLVAGLGKKLADGIKQFLNCFPKDSLTNKTPKKNDGGILDFFLNLLSKMTDPLKTIIKIGGPIISILCKYRLTIVKIVQKLFLQRKLKKLKFRINSEFERTGTISKRLMNKWNLWKAATNFVKKSVKTIVKAGKGLIMGLVNKLFMPWFKPIQNKIFSLMENFKKMLLGGFLVKVIDCGNKFAGKAFEELKKLFGNLKEKFDELNSSLAMGAPITIMYIIDIVFSMVCEKKIFKEGINLIVNAGEQKDSNVKSLMIGKGLGMMVRLMANVKSMVSPMIIKSR